MADRTTDLLANDAPPPQQSRLPSSFEELTQWEEFKNAKKEARFDLGVEYMVGVFSKIPKELYEDPTTQRAWSEWRRQFEILHLDKYRPGVMEGMDKPFDPRGATLAELAARGGFGEGAGQWLQGPLGRTAQGGMLDLKAAIDTQVLSKGAQESAQASQLLKAYEGLSEEEMAKRTPVEIAGQITTMTRAKHKELLQQQVIAANSAMAAGLREARKTLERSQSPELNPELRGWTAYQQLKGLGEYQKLRGESPFNPAAYINAEFGRDFVNFVVAGMADSSGSLVLSGGAAMAGGAVGGVPGSMAGAGVGGGAAEYASRLMQYIGEEANKRLGPEPSPDEIDAAWLAVVSDQKLLKELETVAAKEGVAIGTVEAVTAGVSHGIAAKIMGQGVSIPRVVGSAMIGAPIEMAGGSLGEFSSYIVSGKNPYTGEALKNIFVEGAIEAGGAVSSVAGAAMNVAQRNARLSELEAGLTEQGVSKERAKAAALKIAEAEDAPSKLKAVLDVAREQTREELATEAKEGQNPLFRFDKEGQIREVLTPDGAIQVESEEEATQVLTEQRHLQEVRTMRDYFLKIDEVRGDTNKVIELLDQEAPLALEEMDDATAYEAVRIANANTGEEMTEAQARIFGSNTVDFEGEVAHDVSKIYLGSTLDTVIEERAEGYLKVALTQGEIGTAELNRWLDATASIYGETSETFAGMDPSRVQVERFSKRVIDFLKNRRGELPSTVKAAVDQRIVNEAASVADTETPASIKSFMARLAEYIMHVMRRGVQLFRSIKTGKVDAKFEKALREATGLDAATRQKLMADPNFEDIGAPGRELKGTEIMELQARKGLQLLQDDTMEETETAEAEAWLRSFSIKPYKRPAAPEGEVQPPSLLDALLATQDEAEIAGILAEANKLKKGDLISLAREMGIKKGLRTKKDALEAMMTAAKDPRQTLSTVEDAVALLKEATPETIDEVLKAVDRKGQFSRDQLKQIARAMGVEGPFSARTTRKSLVAEIRRQVAGDPGTLAEEVQILTEEVATLRNQVAEFEMVFKPESWTLANRPQTFSELRQRLIRDMTTSEERSQASREDLAVVAQAQAESQAIYLEARVMGLKGGEKVPLTQWLRSLEGEGAPEGLAGLIERSQANDQVIVELMGRVEKRLLAPMLAHLATAERTLAEFQGPSEGPTFSLRPANKPQPGDRFSWVFWPVEDGNAIAVGNEEFATVAEGTEFAREEGFVDPGARMQGNGTRIVGDGDKSELRLVAHAPGVLREMEQARMAEYARVRAEVQARQGNEVEEETEPPTRAQMEERLGSKLEELFGVAPRQRSQESPARRQARAVIEMARSEADPVQTNAPSIQALRGAPMPVGDWLKLADQSDQPGVAELAKLLSGTDAVALQMPIRLGSIEDAVDASEQLQDGISNANYSRLGESIVAYDGLATETVILHEIIHAATAKKLSVTTFEPGPRYLKLMEKTISERPGPAGEVIALYLEAVRTALPRRYWKALNDPDAMVGFGEDLYPFSNVDEFVAGLYSNPAFVERLNQAQPSLWKRMMDALRRLFGWSKAKGNLVERSFEAAQALIEKPRRPRGGSKGGSLASLQMRPAQYQAQGEQRTFSIRRAVDRDWQSFVGEMRNTIQAMSPADQKTLMVAMEAEAAELPGRNPLEDPAKVQSWLESTLGLIASEEAGRKPVSRRQMLGWIGRAFAPDSPALDRALNSVRTDFSMQADQFARTTLETLLMVVGKQLVGHTFQALTGIAPTVNAYSGEDGIAQYRRQMRSNPLVTLAMVTVVGPVTEETVMRYLPSVVSDIVNREGNPDYFALQPENPHQMHWKTGSVMALLFALLHYVGKENASGIPLTQFLGGLQYWYLMRTRGFQNAALAHGVNNATAVVADMLNQAISGQRTFSLGGPRAKGFDAASQAGRTFAGVDGKSRFEMDASKSKLVGISWQEPEMASGKLLPEVFEFDELYENYPWLRDWKLTLFNGYGGAMVEKERRIHLGHRGPMKRTLLHEIQHAIQRFEGFAVGTNPDYQASLLPDTMTEGARREEGGRRYHFHAGEAESRTVERRMDLTAEQRQQQPFNDALYEDVKPENLIRRFHPKPNQLSRNPTFSIRPSSEMASLMMRGRPSRFALRLAKRRLDAMGRRMMLDYAEEKISWWRDGAGRNKLVDDIRQLETLAAILPMEVRAKLGGFARLASMVKPETRRAYLESKVKDARKFLEEYLRGALMEDVASLIEATETRLNPSRKEKGTLGGEGHAFFEDVKGALAATEEEVEAELAAAQAILENPASTDEMVSDALDSFEIWNVVGALGERNSQEMENAIEWMNEALMIFRGRRRVIEEALAQERAEARQEVRDSIGRGTRDENAETERQSAKQWAATVVAERLDIVQALKQAFPRSPWAEEMGQRLVKAVNQRTDAMTEHRANFKKFARKVFGITDRETIFDDVFVDNAIARRLKPLFDQRSDSGIRVYEGTGPSKIDVPLEQAKRAHRGELLPGYTRHQSQDIARAYQEHLDEGAALEQAVEDGESGAGVKLAGWKRRTKLPGVMIRPGTYELRISEMEAAYYGLILDQEQYQDRAEQLGFPPEARQQIENFLSPEMKQLRDYMREVLRPMYDKINVVFERVNGVNLPQLDVYFPGIFETIGNDKGVIDPFAPENRIHGMMDGFTKRRVPHNARRKRVSAFHAFFSHLEAAEHYIAFHEAARDMRAVIVNPDVQASITAQYGPKRASFFREWTELIEAGGTLTQNTYTSDYDIGNWLLNNLSKTALAGKVSTILVQTSNIFASLQRVPAHKWLLSASKLGVNPVLLARRVAHIWRNSEVIQRRMANGFSPELAAVLNADPRRVSVTDIVPTLLFDLINRVDGGALAVGAAIAYDVELTRALKEAPTRAQAEKLAMERTERILQETQQPVDFINKSLPESLVDPWKKLALYMFISDPRRKVANLIVDMQNAARGDGEAQLQLVGRAAQTAALLFLIMPIWEWLMRGVASAAFRNRDPEDAFDEDDLYAQMMVGPLNGFTLYGPIYEATVRQALGTRTYSNNPLEDIARIPQRMAKDSESSMEAISDGDFLEATKQISEAMTAAGMVYGPLGAVGNTIVHGAGFTQNITDGNFLPDLETSGHEIRDAFGSLVPRPIDQDLALAREYVKQEDKADRLAKKAVDEAEKAEEPELSPTIAAKKTDLDKRLLELKVFGQDETGKQDRSEPGRRVVVLIQLLNRHGAEEHEEMLRHWVEVGVVTKDVRRALEREGFDVPE